ncbi:NeuD/PglB/VioB family sugar acetyltransferase [Avibacterium gallinarum]|uniref:NeuD/PglB/VioB family sugar acetyltransferase n=1 Tax=Avibacterium gallinarum TaxID=755 RepID=UPI003BF7A3BD
MNIGKNKRLYQKYFKRPFDLFCSILAILFFFWLFIIIAILVRIKLGNPILFTQERPGRIDPKTGKETIFKLYKFRTMTDQRDENGNLLPDEIRLTKFGKILRATSLDEIPEIFNILKGDMSIIGPRPLLVKYLDRYSQEQRRRHEVRPGLSGYAQVNGRNAISWEDKFKLDVEYVDNITFLNDLKIIYQTFIKAFIKREGIHSEQSSTMEEFIGNTKSDSNLSNKKLVIIGASGHGKVAADIARLTGYSEISFLDDNENIKECNGYPVLGKTELLETLDNDIFIAIGNNKIRRELIKNLQNKKLVTLIHPSAVITKDTKIEKGTVIMAGAVINSNCFIGEGVIINTSSSIDHDCYIGNYTHVSVGCHIAGTVDIGQNCWLGIGSIVSNNIDICDDSIIGAGAVVIKNIEKAGTYVGVPAIQMVK